MEEEEFCVPEKAERSNKYHSGDFNCNLCRQSDCFYWVLYNGVLEETTEEEDS